MMIIYTAIFAQCVYLDVHLLYQTNQKHYTMKKAKQLIERNLKFNQKYIYLEIIRGSIESGQFCTCDNCGKLITNMVKVANKDTKKQHYIGTDCAETLAQAKCLYNNGMATDYRVDLYSFNKTLRFVSELNKGKKYTGNEFRFYVNDDKGKTLECSPYDLKHYFPEKLQSIEPTYK